LGIAAIESFQLVWRKGVMKYSVIIATNGKSPFLQATLDSIVSQDVAVELIIVNDAVEESEMETIRLCVLRCNAYNAKIVRSERRGVSAARNTGISFSSGDVLFFCDDDDTWSPERVRLQASIIVATGADFHLANYHTIDELDILKEAKSRECFENFPKNLSFLNYVPPSGWAIKRPVFDRIGLFDESFRTTEDKDFFIRAAQNIRLVRSGPVLWNYRIRAGAMSRNLQQKALYNAKLIAKHRGLLFSCLPHTTALLDFSCKVFIANGSYMFAFKTLSGVLASNLKLTQKIKFISRVIVYQLLRKKIRRKVS
jgi:glycosyltransferase involved in cell wall biosynthesis